MKALKIILAIVILALLAEVGFLVYVNFGDEILSAITTKEPTEAVTEAPAASTEGVLDGGADIEVEASTEAPTEEPTTEAPTTEAPTTEAPTTEAPATEAPTTEAPTEVPTEAETEAPTEAATEAPTEEPTEAATEEPTEAPTEEPKKETERFVLTFAGNCTLGGDYTDNSSATFVNVVGDNYDYPFQNMEKYFHNDEFTFVTLEGVLADDAKPAQDGYLFLGPSHYAKILTTGGIDAVSLANDHTDDFGKDGYAATKAALEAESVSYVEQDSSMIYTTEHGLKIGVYAVYKKLDRWDMQQSIKQMRKDGADLVIVAFHWAEDAPYAPNMVQINAAHAAIDNGADAVIGTNSYYLQGIESYGSGMICYSLGNFCYGGTKWPKDTDSTIIQFEVLRDSDGNVTLSDTYFIPCAITSKEGINNFQPTVLEADSWQYNSVLKKLTEPVLKPVK